MAARIIPETLIGLLRADPVSYLSVYSRFTPFLGADLTLGPTPDPSITGNRSYTRPMPPSEPWSAGCTVTANMLFDSYLVVS